MKKNNETLIVERDNNDVVSVTINRPNVKNALDEELITYLSETLIELEKEPIRVLQLRASGDHFSAGADLAWMQKAQTLGQQENYKDVLKLAELLKTLYLFSAPVLTVVNGPAYGGALGIIAASDIVIADQSSQFCFSEVKLGLIPGVISPYIVHAIGARQTQRYFLTAEMFHAEQARMLGLVHEICPKEQLEDTVTKATQQLIRGGPTAQTEVKKLIHAIHYQQLNGDVIGLTAKKIADIRVTEEAKEGLDAFFNKRKPVWRQP